MKQFAIAMRVNGAEYLTYTRIYGKSIEQVDELTVIVDGVKIEFGEFIESIESRDV